MSETISMTDILLTVSVGCNLWFLFLLSRDVHSKILKIVNDIAGREISVGGYVDTVLRQHLEQHKEKINELYKKQREDLI